MIGLCKPDTGDNIFITFYAARGQEVMCAHSLADGAADASGIAQRVRFMLPIGGMAPLTHSIGCGCFKPLRRLLL